MKIIKEFTDKDIINSNKLSIKNPKISARAILIDDENKIALMYVKKKEAFSIPGGGIKENETILEGLEREILEETGCNCSSLYEIGIVSENRAEHDFTQLSHYYLARVVGAKGRTKFTKSEILNQNKVVWFSIKEFNEILYNQIPIDYQFEFIKKRDTEIINYLKNSNCEVSKIFKGMVGEINI